MGVDGLSESLSFLVPAAAAGAVAVPLIDRLVERLPALLPAEPSALIVGVLRPRAAAGLPAERQRRLLRCALLWCTVPLVSGLIGVQFAGGPAAWALALFWGLATLAAVDAEAHVLPDALTLPLILLGLVANLAGRFCTLEASVMGAALGYALFVACALVGRAMGRADPLGSGDQKEAALLGAWFGLWSLPYLVLGLVAAASAEVACSRYGGARPALPLGPAFAVVGTAALFLWPGAAPF
jgi:prepilin signal peptidase PulO-like enzyme (type II secretory pathway)